MHALEVIIAMNNRRPAPRQCTACGQRVDEPARPPAPVKAEPLAHPTGQARHQARSHAHS